MAVMEDDFSPIPASIRPVSRTPEAEAAPRAAPVCSDAGARPNPSRARSR